MCSKTLIMLFAAICILTSCTSKKEKALAFFKSGKEDIRYNKLKAGLADFNKAIENDPELDQAWYYRANTKYNLRDYPGAMADYNECIRLNPGIAEAFANRGQLKFQMGDKDGACADWLKAKDLGMENMRDLLQYCR